MGVSFLFGDAMCEHCMPHSTGACRYRSFLAGSSYPNGSMNELTYRQMYSYLQI